MFVIRVAFRSAADSYMYFCSRSCLVCWLLPTCCLLLLCAIPFYLQCGQETGYSNHTHIYPFWVGLSRCLREIRILKHLLTLQYFFLFFPVMNTLSVQFFLTVVIILMQHPFYRWGQSDVLRAYRKYVPMCDDRQSRLASSIQSLFHSTESG